MTQPRPTTPPAFSRLICGLVLLAMLATTSPAGAAELVVYDEAVSLSSVSRIAKRELEGAEYVARPLSTLSRGWSDVVLLGAAQKVDCFGSLGGFEGLQSRLAEAQAALDLLERGEADRILALTRAALPCADEFLPPDTLSDLFFLEGVMAAFTEDPSKATMHFCESAAIHPERTFDESYPPTTQTLFDAGVSLGDSVPWAKLQFDVAHLDLRELRLDGIDVPAWTQSREVVPGYHVVQWRDRAGRVDTLAFGIGEGTEATVGAAQTVALGILQGPAADRSAADTARARLTAAAKSTGASRVLVVGPDGARSFDPKTGSWSTLKN